MSSPFTSTYPATRLRRTRQADWSRRLVRELSLSVDDLVQPMFVSDSTDGREAIANLPGQNRVDIERLVEDAQAANELGIPAIALFPHIRESDKSEDGAEASNREGLVQRAVRAVKAQVPDIAVITDVALDPYTTHGHDGILEGDLIKNDETVDELVAAALSLADAGADVIAPSDMMDGRVGAIRQAFESAGHHDMLILSYAAKYASGFYGPYRDAIGTKAALRGDKRTYQMDPLRREEALHEVGQDLQEGADMVMVKPGLPYLDIIRDIREAYAVPTLAYQVSGEYAMIRAAGERGMIDEKRVILESLMSFKRAGCAAVFTYFAADVAKWLKDGDV
jgi:porphobilinogen synthase